MKGKKFFLLPIDGFSLFHIDILRYFFRARITKKKTLNKKKGAGRVNLYNLTRGLTWRSSFSVKTLVISSAHCQRIEAQNLGPTVGSSIPCK